MSVNVQEFTDENFGSDVVQSDIPVLIDFWATWCGPCKMIAPIIEEIASDYDGKIKVGKVNVDENGGTAMKYGIRSIPTLLVMKDGQIINQKVGAIHKAEIKKGIEAESYYHRLWSGRTHRRYLCGSSQSGTTRF